MNISLQQLHEIAKIAEIYYLFGLGNSIESIKLT